MATAAEPAPRMPRGRQRARTAAKWTGIGLIGLVVALLLFFIWLNSSLGRSFVVKQINQLETASGLDIDVERIEGSLFGELTLHGLTLKDPKGTFLVAPEATLDWRPLAYFRNHIDIKRLEIPQARLYRLPELKPGDPDAPLLPDINVDIGQIKVDRMLIDPPVTGYRHLLSLAGSARIDDGRAQVALDANAIAGPGLPGGDKLALRIDAVPEANRLAIGVRVEAPADGFVAKLSGLNQPLVATLGGNGTWKNWRGKARAVLGGKEFADLAVGAKDGAFTVSGPMNPGLLMPAGVAKNLLSPHVQVNLTTKLDQRRADTRLTLTSPALGIVAEGMLDLGRNQFQDFKVAARLSRPRAIGPNIDGTDLRVAAVLNGAFRTPFVAYDLRARSLSFNDTTIELLQARGRAKVDTDRIRIPVQARARRISGLDPSLGSLLTNVSANGTINISGTRLVSDNLKVRSDRLNATVVLAADLAKGQYRAAIQGTVDNYLMEGIGLLDLTTDMDVFSAGNGFGLKGRVAVRTRRIDNPTAAGILEGNATASANVVMTPSGVITLDNVRLSSPGLRITSGGGTIWPDGRIAIRAAGVSRTYGALAVVVRGTATRPQIQLRAASPGFGIGLRDVTATVRAVAGGYAVSAKGQSAYGPFEADVTILSGRGPMTIEVRRLLFAGMTFTGRVVRTSAGPFAGTLAMTGQGLQGTIQLSAVGRYQRADVDATASGAQIPGENPILIQRGIVRASVILYPDAPHIVGDAQLAGVRSNNFFLARARAKVDYRGGNGTAQLFAEGTSGMPFRVAVNAALSPNLIRTAAQGQVRNIPFRLARPAEISKVAGGWQLAPAELVLPQGNVRLAGRYGDGGMVIQSRLDDFDVSFLNLFSPGLGLGGRATGSIDFAQVGGDSFPRADARLTVAGFTRSGIAVRSPPVDLAIAGQLRPEGGNLAAVIRRDSAVIGRAQLRLQPVGPGAGGWTARLLAAPLAGGIRYNGPAEVLWSLSGVADMQLSGPIGVAADFSGRVQSPQLTGIVRANNLTFVHETYGTKISQLALQGRFTSSELQLTQLSGRAGSGTISGTGTVGFASAAGYPMDIRLKLDEAQLARSDNIGATLTGDLAITNSRAGGALISGDLSLPEVRYQIIRQGAAQIVELAGVRRKGEPLPTVRDATQQADTAPSIWKLDLRLRADNRLFIAGMGLESEWSADLRVQGTTATPSILGEADLIRGTYSFSGQRFDVTRGHIQFTGQRPPNPRLDIVASADIKDVTVNINVSGSANNPQIAFTSNPGLPQDEIMARILFGGSVTEISALQAVQLATSLNSLRGGGGGLNPLGKLRSSTGLDRLRILGADDTTGRGTAIAAGFYVSNDIYLEIITDARGFTATQIEVALSRALSILSQVSTSGGGNNVNLRYRKQY
ncbi:MAG TPA: translocation/assembly module TamB domain-containing protein [Allosphingosinicella sp.]|nr:translocation/assembly module TamB domain-containing protein [Allosphingosinicella sp.]